MVTSYEGHLILRLKIKGGMGGQCGREKCRLRMKV